MRKALMLSFVFLSLPVLVNAQPAREHRGYGYGFGGPGVATSRNPTATLHVGMGGELRVYKGLGAGGELGYFAPITEMGAGIGITAANGSYHFSNAGSGGKLQPFATGGYSLAFRSDTGNGFNVGGGVNYWFKERLGMRFEVRDHIFPLFGNTNFLSFRVGITFR